MRGRHSGFNDNTQVITNDVFEVEEGDTLDGATCEECLQPLAVGDLVTESFTIHESGYAHVTCPPGETS